MGKVEKKKFGEETYRVTKIIGACERLGLLEV